MPNVKLPCAIGGECDYETINLPYEQAKDLLEIHMMYAHRDAQPVSSNKPEKFPRPEIKLDSTAENWEEFVVTWAQYKEEYKLAGAGLVRQLIASCMYSSSSLSLNSRTRESVTTSPDSEVSPADVTSQ